MRRAAVLLVAMATAAVLAGCGGGGGSSDTTAETEATSATGGGGGGGGALAIAAADSGLAYSTDTATTTAGNVTVDFDNPQPIAHDVAFENDSGETVGQTAIVTDGKDSAVVDFEPGTYTFYCTVPGHREAGMEGTLTVK